MLNYKKVVALPFKESDLIAWYLEQATKPQEQVIGAALFPASQLVSEGRGNRVSLAI